jgi:hypothetical protein
MPSDIFRVARILCFFFVSFLALFCGVFFGLRVVYCVKFAHFRVQTGCLDVRLWTEIKSTGIVTLSMLSLRVTCSPHLSEVAVKEGKVAQY